MIVKRKDIERVVGKIQGYDNEANGWDKHVIDLIWHIYYGYGLIKWERDFDRKMAIESEERRKSDEFLRSYGVR